MNRTIAGAKELNRRNGYFFFSPDTMKFFASKVESEILNGSYFITSEKKCFDDYTRVFRVREINWETGDISTLAGPLDSYEDALTYIKGE